MYEQMLKMGSIFPLSALHHRLLQYLGLFITQISPNAWRVFLGAKVLYGVMSDGAQRIKVEEFFIVIVLLRSPNQEACTVSCLGVRCLG